MSKIPSLQGISQGVGQAFQWFGEKSEASAEWRRDEKTLERSYEKTRGEAFTKGAKGVINFVKETFHLGSTETDLNDTGTEATQEFGESFYRKGGLPQAPKPQIPWNRRVRRPNHGTRVRHPDHRSRHEAKMESEMEDKRAAAAKSLLKANIKSKNIKVRQGTHRSDPSAIKGAMFVGGIHRFARAENIEAIRHENQTKRESLEKADLEIQ